MEISKDIDVVSETNDAPENGSSEVTAEEDTLIPKPFAIDAPRTLLSLLGNLGLTFDEDFERVVKGLSIPETVTAEESKAKALEERKEKIRNVQKLASDCMVQFRELKEKAAVCKHHADLIEAMRSNLAEMTLGSSAWEKDRQELRRQSEQFDRNRAHLFRLVDEMYDMMKMVSGKLDEVEFGLRKSWDSL